MKNINVIQYYKNITDNIEELGYTISEDMEGFHECILLDIKTNETFNFEGLEYYPSFIIFYGTICEEGAEISCKSTGYVDDIYSFTNKGYLEGLYISKDIEIEELKIMFNKIISIIKKRFSRGVVK